VLSLKDGSTRQLATELEGGVFGRFDISFDARRIVFDWKRANDEGYRIYEANVDGSGLRQVPGVPNNYVLLGCPHFPHNALGTIVRIDMNQPIRSEAPMTCLTPEVKVLSEGGWHFLDPDSGQMTTGGGKGPLYRDPWPIDADRCLVAHKPRGFGHCNEPNGYGLYLLEAPGKVATFFRRTAPDHQLGRHQRPMPRILLRPT